MSSIARKMALYLERKRRCEHVTLAGDDLCALRFFQFREANTPVLVRRAGKCDVLLKDTPHYAFASGLAQGDGNDTCGESVYREYLDEAWRQRSAEERQAQIQSFRRYFKGVADNQIRPKRAVLTRIDADGPYYVVDGNHRAAFALALNRPLRAEIWPFDLVFRRYGPRSLFYEINKLGKPYHTISYRGNTIIPGRRIDIEQRIELIPKKIIQGRRILDLGANIGMNAIAAKHGGAKSVTGIEISQGLADWANRFSVLEGFWPDVRVFQGDAADPELLKDQKFDAVFMMSIFAHVPDKIALASVVRDRGIKNVVFECHSGTSWRDYAKYFGDEFFSSEKLLGVLNASATSPVPDRELWLLSRND